MAQVVPIDTGTDGLLRVVKPALSFSNLMLTPDTPLGEVLAGAIHSPKGRLDLTDQSGVVVATITVYNNQAVRPKDMPRALRPKQKLSKRQRVAARHAKLPPAG